MLMDTLSIKDRDSMFPGYLKNSTIPLFPKESFQDVTSSMKENFEIIHVALFPQTSGSVALIKYSVHQLN